MRYWFLWEVGIPLAVLGSFWPVNRFIVGDPNAFQQAFCHGDLFLFASLLLMGVAMDVKLREREWKARGVDGDLGFTREVSRAIAFIAILGYGVVRYHFVFQDGPIDMGIRTGYACASWSVVVLAVGQGSYALAKAAHYRSESAGVEALR